MILKIRFIIFQPTHFVYRQHWRCLQWIAINVICCFAGTPDTPSDISVSVLTGTSARVSWQTNYKGLLDRIFHIQIQAVGASTWRVWNVADTSLDGQMSYDIDGLLADTSYVLRMYASNAAGSSATSNGVSFVTQGTCILYNEQNF